MTTRRMTPLPSGHVMALQEMDPPGSGVIRVSIDAGVFLRKREDGTYEVHRTRTPTGRTHKGLTEAEAIQIAQTEAMKMLGSPP